MTTTKYYVLRFERGPLTQLITKTWPPPERINPLDTVDGVQWFDARGASAGYYKLENTKKLTPGEILELGGDEVGWYIWVAEPTDRKAK